MRSVAVAVLLTLIAADSAAQTVVPFQPDVRWGGRSVAVTVDPADTSQAIAAAERGGLFKTQDGGITWRHLDRLQMYRMHDVKFAPVSPPGSRVVIATGPGDFRVQNRGGIWRSTNGGETWIKPGNSNPECSPSAAAYGIAFEPNGANVYVGTDCGIAISRDFGATWRHFRAPSDDRAAPPIGAVLAVAAQAGGLVDIGSVRGNTREHIRFSFDGESFSSVRGVGRAEWVSSMAVSPLEPSVVYIAEDGGLAEIEAPVRPTAGSVTRRFEVTPEGCCGIGRPNNWVATTLSRDGDPNHFDIYFSDGFQTWRKTCGNSGERPRCGRTGWSRLNVDHEDHNGIAFNPATHRAAFLAGDGGVHRPTDADNPREVGANWRITGAGRNGFNALQIYEVTGQMIGNPAAPDRIDLYFGTQDNHLFASPDSDSRRWPVEIGNEGWRIQAARAIGDDNGKVTWSQPSLRGGCCDYIGDRRFNEGAWPVGEIPPIGFNAWNGPPGTFEFGPTLISPRVYVQFTRQGRDGHITRDNGATWMRAFGIAWRTQQERWIQIAKLEDDISLFLPSWRPDGTLGLFKVSGLRADGTLAPSGARWQLADGFFHTGITALGRTADQFIWKAVYAVDPNDPNYLIAADAGAGKMKVSRDGGLHWAVDETLTALVTGYREDLGAISEFRFTLPGFITQARVIAFDPDHRGHILIGTEAGGILRSTDGGETWGAVPNTRQITSITSFHFIPERASNPNAEVIVSSFGRGLWKLIIPPGTEVRPFSITPIVPTWGEWMRHGSTGMVDAQMMGKMGKCPACRWFAVSGGSIQDLSLDQRGRIAAIAVSEGAYVSGSTQDGRRLVVDMPVLKQSKSGEFQGCPGCVEIVKKGGEVRGVVLNGGELAWIIAGFGALPKEEMVRAFDPPIPTPPSAPELTPPKEPSLVVEGTLPTGGAAAFVGSKVSVFGSGFCSECGPVEIRVGERFASAAQADAKGEVEQQIALVEEDASIGQRVSSVEVTAIQKDAKGQLIQARTSLLVAVGHDEVPNNKAAGTTAKGDAQATELE